MRIGFISAFMLCAGATLLPSLADARVLSANASTISSVLKLARPGDTIVATGRLNVVTIANANFNSGITLDLSQARLTRLAISNTQGLHVVGGRWTAAAVKEQVVVTQSSDVSFDHPVLVADGAAYGFKIADSSNVAVRGAVISNAFQAINSGRVTGAIYSDNTIRNANNDSVVIYNNHGVTIQNNSIGDNLRVDDRHPDGIQFIYRDDGLTSTDVVVRGNHIIGETQGIFGAGIVRGDIAGNTIKVDHGNAIALDCTSCRIWNNLVSTLSGSVHQASINGLNGDILHCGNVVRPGAGKVGMIERACPQGWAQATNPIASANAALTQSKPILLKASAHVDPSAVTSGLERQRALFSPASAVPEPDVWAMLLLGFGGIGASLRIRRRHMAA